MVTNLWKHRYLVRELVRRDVKSRYRGSLLGGVWSILNPLLQLTVYTLVFSGFLHQSFDQSASSGRFALFLFAALLPWLAFQESLHRSARSFLDHSQLINKARFPLPALPLGIMTSAFLHQCVGTLLFIAVLAFKQEVNLLTLWIWPFAGLLQLTLVFGLSLILACVTVLVRDVAQALGAVFLILFWTTPIVYPQSRAGDLAWILDLNPLTHLVGLHRYVFFGQPSPSPGGLLYLIVVALGGCLLGAAVHSRTRKLIVDLV